MYDWPELRPENDALWAAIAARLRQAGIDAPDQLSRDGGEAAIWTMSELLLSQTCGYPYVSRLRGQVRLVATPHYRADGCDGADYCSWILVRNDSDLDGLAALGGQRAAVNHQHSHSGWVALRATLGAAPDQIVLSGSHLQSLQAVADGRADYCACDTVCWALARRYRPELASQLRTVAASPMAPGLPLITAGRRSDHELALIRDAVKDAFHDPDLAAVRESLLLDGLSVLDDSEYDRILELKRQGGLID